MAATAEAARPISPCTDVYLYDYRYVNDLQTTIYLVYTYISVYIHLRYACQSSVVGIMQRSLAAFGIYFHSLRSQLFEVSAR